MKKLTVGELKRRCEHDKPRKIVFCTENQPCRMVEDTVRFDFTFSVMLIECNPNVIYLKSGNNMMCFDRVKYVTADPDRTPLGIVLNITCGAASGDKNDTEYTLIVA